MMAQAALSAGSPDYKLKSCIGIIDIVIGKLCPVPAAPLRHPHAMARQHKIRPVDAGFRHSANPAANARQAREMQVFDLKFAIQLEISAS